MKLIRGIHNLNYVPHNCVLTIGNFDGVHRGHQVLLKRLQKEGIARNLPIIIMIFEPQPLELFAGKHAPARLTNLREKLQYLSKYNIDYVLCIYFNQKFAGMTAQDFILDLLVKRLGVRFLVVGDDFRFGIGRQGDFSLLQKASLKYNFTVVSSSTFCEGNVRVSSTAVRQALLENKLEKVENLLGHPFTISGRVVHGNKLGRIIGFPTANLLLHRKVSPVEGVYVVEVIGIDKKPIPGIANIGTRQTLGGIIKQLEVYLLNTTINLYGYHIDVILRKKIRDEQRFASLKDLSRQISRDELVARTFFGLSNSS